MDGSVLDMLQRNRKRDPDMSEEEATKKALEIGYELGLRIMRKHGDMKMQKFASLLHKEVTEFRMSKSVRRLVKKAAEKGRMDWKKSNITPNV